MTENPDKFLIVGLSGRSLAAAAVRAGHDVCVADLFRDRDTQELALASTKIKSDDNGGLDRDSLIEAVSHLAPVGTPIVYNSGLEGRPEILNALGATHPLAGNSPQTLSRIKDPNHFFALLDSLGAAHPDIRLDPPRSPDGWLVKRIGGSGGAHIFPASQDPNIQTPAEGGPEGSPVYYQRIVSGQPHSVLFLANGTDAMTLGYSQQWCDPCADAPYRYGGAISNVPLASDIAKKLSTLIVSLTQEEGLLGLASLDILLNHQGTGFEVLEINPRPGATLDIFDPFCGHYLFDLHLEAVKGVLPDQATLSAPSGHRACCVLYAPSPMVIPADFSWPQWTADIPQITASLPAGGPICTILSAGDTTQAARTLLTERSRALRNQLLRSMGSAS